MVISGVNTVTYNGDGSTTAWPYSFPVTDDNEIKLQLVNADGTAFDITSDYYVDLVNSTVYYPGYAPGSEPPEADQPPKVQVGQKITVYREIPMTQEADLGEAWPFSVIEHGLDKLTMICQQIYSGTIRELDEAVADMTYAAGVVVDSEKLKQIATQTQIMEESAAKAAAAASTATSAASSASTSATGANTSALAAAASAHDADTTAAALTAYLADKEELTAPAVDTTLSVAGAAADAEVTGETFGTVVHTITTNAATVIQAGDWEPGSIDSTTGANLSSNYYLRTGYFPISYLSSYEFTGVTRGAGETYDRIHFNYCYDINKTYLGRKENEFIADTFYVRFTYGFNTSSGIKVSDYGQANLIADYGALIKSPLQRILDNTLIHRGLLNSSDDVNDVWDTGVYTMTNASLPANLPTNVSGNLIVYSYYDTGNTTNTNRRAQMFVNGDDVFMRYRTSSGWSAWRNLAWRIPDNNYEARLLNYDKAQCQKPTEVQVNTLPKKPSGAVPETYSAGDIVNGVLYSSVWRDGQDVFRNMTLETYYSAMANPASVMYTLDYRTVGISNAWAWYGGVCSTFVGRVVGIGPFYSTEALMEYMDEYEITDYRLLKVGDYLIYHAGSGHIQLISQVYVDTNGTPCAFGITEQTSAGSAVNRSSVVEVGNFENYLATNGYKMYHNAFGEPVLLDDGTFASDVLYEYGNRIYRTTSEVSGGMWFYIPTGSTVYYRKDGGDWSSIALSGVTTDTVNSVTVYDLQSIFSGVGVYDVTTDTDNAKYCTVKIIDTGTISVSNGIVTLSGYSGCTPKYCYMVRIVSGTTDSSMNPPAGYHCTYKNQAKEITSDTVDMSEYVTTDYPGYKIWVDYDTNGFGYKQGLSNDIFF